MYVCKNEKNENQKDKINVAGPPKGSTVAAKDCSPLQELEKATSREAIFLVLVKVQSTLPVA